MSKNVGFIIFLFACTYVVCAATYDEKEFPVEIKILPANRCPQAVIGKVNLSASGGMGAVRNVHPEILTLHNGDVMILWESGEDKRRNDIVFRILDHQTGRWNPPLDSKPSVAVSCIYNSQYPQAVEDRNGLVHMCYMDGDVSSNRDVYYVTYQQNSWSRPQNVRTTPVNSAWPRIVLDPENDDVYISWQHVLNNSCNGKDIVYVMKPTGSSSWKEMKNLSKTFCTQSIHQATAFSNGHFQAVWMDGVSSWDQWGLAANWIDPDGSHGETVTLINPVSVNQPQWPDIQADSQENILGIFSQREAPLKYLYKQRESYTWDIGFLADRGGITFFGLTVARNDVAYAMYRQPVAGGFYPVYIRFTEGNVSLPEVIDDEPVAQPWIGHMDVAVALDGDIHSVWSSGVTSHIPTAIWYKRLAQPDEAPEVRIEVKEVVGCRVTFAGDILNHNHKLINHCWYIHSPRIWSQGRSLAVSFPQAGLYEVHYVVSDADNLYGHDSVKVEMKDVPFPPQDPSIRTVFEQSFLIRAYVNALSWKHDLRNDDSFDVTHFNIYRRKPGQVDWGEAAARILFEGELLYRHVDLNFFQTIAEAENRYEFAVTTVAQVNGEWRESPRAYFTRQ